MVTYIELLTVQDIAKIVGVDIETVYRWIRLKQLKAYRVGREWRIKKEDFDNFLIPSN